MINDKPLVLAHLSDSGALALAALSDLARVTRADTQSAFLGRVGTTDWRAVVVEVRDEADLRLLARIAEALPRGVILATHPAPTMDLVLETEALGVAFLVRHPPDPDGLRALLEPYLSEGGDHALASAATPDDERVVGSSPALTEAYRTVARVASSTASVLIEGASGTGKELVARALHGRSPRKGKPFVAVNCAALPEGLLEAELFGYEKGAFTGAVGRSEGRFGRANGGTLFLDEIGEMGLGLQAKLLRVLESGEVDRLGGAGPVHVDVRVVAATNRDLEARVRDGAFREDLLFRIAVVRIGLPPLRARMEDLVPLTEAFVARFAERHGRPIHALSSQALAALRERSWPGNVRELRNVLDRAVLLARGGVIRSVDLGEPGEAPRLSPLEDPGTEGYPPTWSLKEVEERHIRRVLAATAGHLGEAAEILGVHRNTMTGKVREYGIDPKAPLAVDKGGPAV